MDGDTDRDNDTELACPMCGTAMESRPLGDGEVSACPDGHGVFLRRADLGSLVEAEQDWHRHAGQHTMPMPRITADMTAPPVTKPPARAWVETLFH
jgi:Zn-finger nucleic acid-binding protein